MDENAIRDFRSVCREHNIAENRIPNVEKIIRGAVRECSESGMRVLIRKIPYPPSLSKVPARIMDPAMGASTCAFGSQR